MGHCGGRGGRQPIDSSPPPLKVTTLIFVFCAGQSVFWSTAQHHAAKAAEGGAFRTSAAGSSAAAVLPWIPSSSFGRRCARARRPRYGAHVSAPRFARLVSTLCCPARTKHLKKSRSSGCRLSCCNLQETRHLGAIAYPAKLAIT
jgi:hypothetical protein